MELSISMPMETDVTCWDQACNMKDVDMQQDSLMRFGLDNSEERSIY